MTNERWLSTLHRVNPPVVDGKIAQRMSAAYFHDGNADATVEAIPTCVEPGTKPIHPPIRISEHIEEKVRGIKDGTAKVKAGREAQRAAQAVER